MPNNPRLVNKVPFSSGFWDAAQGGLSVAAPVGVLGLQTWTRLVLLLLLLPRSTLCSQRGLVATLHACNSCSAAHPKVAAIFTPPSSAEEDRGARALGDRNAQRPSSRGRPRLLGINRRWRFYRYLSGNLHPCGTGDVAYGCYAFARCGVFHGYAQFAQIAMVTRSAPCDFCDKAPPKC